MMLAFKEVIQIFVSLGEVKETLDTEVLPVMACKCFSCDV